MLAIQKRNKLYKKSRHSGLETDQDNFKVANALAESDTEEKEILLWRRTR